MTRWPRRAPCRHRSHAEIRTAALSSNTFFDAYTEDDPAVTDAARDRTRRGRGSRRPLSVHRYRHGRTVARLDLFPRRHRPRHHLRRHGGDQHGAWRIHHDGRLYRLCGAALHPELHALAPCGPAAGLRRDLRRRRRNGASGDPLPLPPPARDAARDIRHLDRAATARQEHLRHAGTPPDLARAGSMAPG